MKKYTLAIILICSFILRVYKGPELFFWNIDEDIIGLTVKRMFTDNHPQLIGFPIPGGIYLGPLFYYIISVFYIIAFFDPGKFYILSVLLATLTTFLVYKVGSTIFEKKAIGIIAAFIFAFSYFSNVYSRLLTGLSFGPILSLITYWILYQNMKLKKTKWLLALGIVLLIASQNEGSSLSLLALTILTFIIFKLKVPVAKLKQVIGLFVLFHIPLLIFDLRHNFHITKSFLSFVSLSGNSSTPSFSLDTITSAIEIFPLTVSRILFPTGELSTSSQILPCADLIFPRISAISPLIFSLSTVILGFFLLRVSLKRSKTAGENIIVLHLLTAVLGVIAFNVFLTGYLYEWILIVLLPAFCFIIAYSFAYLYEKSIYLKVFLGILLICFITINLKAVLDSKDNFGLAAKKAIVREAIEHIDNREYYLESLGSCYQMGYMYLFWQAGHFPTSSWMDDMFSPTYYPRTFTKADTKIVISNPSKNESKQFFEKYNY